MIKKKWNKLVALCLSAVGILSFGATKIYAEEEAVSYYVAFSSDNYQVKNSNIMSPIDVDGDSVIDYYCLENRTLSSSVDFYVISSLEEKYYSSDGSNMKVSEEDSHKYNIYFNPTEIYDAAKVENTSLEETNCHISYEYYVPGHFTMEINDVLQKDFAYNAYISTYNAYILPEVSIESNSVIKVTDLDTSTVYEKTMEVSGNYRIVFTPTVRRGMDDYRFDKEGNYGTGEEYTENFYITDVEYYYISFVDSYPNSDTGITFTCEDKEIYGYRLVKDEKKPQANVFESGRFFITSKDTDVSYAIYHYSYIFNKYERIDDDNDVDTLVSEKTLSDVSWYSTAFVYQDGKYSTSFSKEESDFGGYYLIGEFNHYGFTEDGGLNLEDKYLLVEVSESSEYYDKDSKQYLLSGFIITKDMLDIDEDTYEFYIGNGKKKTSLISIKTPGTYDILYSNETNYNGSSYKYIRTEESEDVYSSYHINSVGDFLDLVDQWNMDSESSKYVIYHITADLDFTGITIAPISIFNGIIYGHDHILSNITLLDENGNEGIAVFQLITKYGKITDLTIENLCIEAEDSSYVGFIGRNYGFLENLHISGRVTGKEYVGGLVGYNGNYSTDSDTTTDSTIKYGYGVIQKCTSDVAVLGHVIVGGVSGFNGGKILSTTNQGVINHKAYSSSVTILNIGGITGYSTGEIVDSSNTGLVGYKKTGKNVGGIAGLCNGEIYFSMNSADIYGKENVGGLVGYFGSVKSDEDSKGSMDIASYYVPVNQTQEPEEFTEEQDISKHRIYYSYNISDVHATTYVGGILGYTNSTDVSIHVAVSKSNVYSDSGSYAGGIAGYLGGGEIVSSGFVGYVEANGTTNRYVGGIAGYSNGSITGCSSNATLNGNEYVGGIAGYATSSATTISNYTNVYMITKSTLAHVGNICGFIDGFDSASGTYQDRAKYNYFLGSDLSDYSGINGIHYGKASHYAAARIFFSDVVENDFMTLVSKKFGEYDEEENYFISGGQLPLLKWLSVCDELEDDSFDDDTDTYAEYSSYFEKNKETYFDFQNDLAKLKARIVFKEWDSELDDNTLDNYVVNTVIEVKYGEDISSIELPLFLYADNSLTKRKDALYSVSWSLVDTSFKNQTVYASYKEMITSYQDKEHGVFVEGEFSSNTQISVTEEKGIYHILIKENGQEITKDDLTVRIHVENPKKSYILVDGVEVTSQAYGEYLVFTLLHSKSSFQVMEAPFSLSQLPDYAIALMVVIPLLLVFVIAIIVSNVKKPKEEKKEIEETLKEETKANEPEEVKQEQPKPVVLSKEEQRQRQLENLKKAREAKMKKNTK